MIPYATECDQLDVTNYAPFEKIGRRVMFIEEDYLQKLEGERLSKNADNSTAVLAESFAGEPRMAGGAMVSPVLLKHAADRAAATNDILKQQRKTAEVAAVLKKKGGGGGGGGDKA